MTDNKIPTPCQEKNIAFKGRRDPPNNYFFFVAFFVVFFALGCFIPQDMISFTSLIFFYIDLFIPFNLIFVKNFLKDIRLPLNNCCNLRY